MTEAKTPTVTALCLMTALSLAVAVPAAAQTAEDVGPEFLYEGPGTVVTGIDNDGSASTVTDSGGVVCEDVDGDGTPERGRGGTCIPFETFYDGWNSTDQRPTPRANSIHVSDGEVPDDRIAFQVCVDLDGSRTCGGPSEADNEFCRDLIQYSHDTDTGEVFNPLFVPAKELPFLWEECSENGGFPGFIVITCAGLHAHVDEGADGTPQTTHTHEVTSGVAQPAFTDDFGQGDYCGAPPPGGFGEEATQPSREKVYRTP